jgi:SWIM zinc finger
MSKIYLSRKMKAQQIYQQRNIKQVGVSFSFKVRSQTNPNIEYAVFHDGKESFCECKDFELRQQPCKHIHAVDLLKYGMIKEVIAK